MGCRAHTSVHSEVHAALVFSQDAIHVMTLHSQNYQMLRRSFIDNAGNTDEINNRNALEILNFI